MSKVADTTENEAKNNMTKYMSIFNYTQGSTSPPTTSCWPARLEYGEFSVGKVNVVIFVWRF